MAADLPKQHPFVTTAITIAFAFGGSWAGAQMRVDNLEKRVERLEANSIKDREEMAKVLSAIQQTDRRLALWICSQDPKRCGE
jgi:hypothetical protein